MFFQIVTDLLLLLHLLFVLFVVAGGFLALRRKWLAILHLPAAAWGAFIEFSGILCPLTPIEDHLRRLAAQHGAAESVIEQFLRPVLYPSGLTFSVRMLLGLVVVLLTLVPYTLLFLRRRHSRKE